MEASMIPVRPIVERLQNRGFAIQDSYLDPKGKVFVRIRGISLTLFDQGVQLAEGHVSFEEVAGLLQELGGSLPV